MKAVVMKQHGTLEQIQVSDVPVPEFGPGEVLVEIKAAALNRLDLWVLAGWPSLRLHMPHILGSDGAGIVRAVGDGVSRVRIGDRVAINPTLSDPEDEFSLSGRDNLSDGFAVMGEHAPGFFAEYQKVPARNLLPLPAHVSFEAAAAASLVFLTAWHSLVVRGRLQAGEEVLVIGAGGGVNTAAIQIARLAGAGRIFVVGSTPEKLAEAGRLGATDLIPRGDGDWGRAVFQLTGRRGVDIVVDNVGAPTYHTSLRSLKKGGRLLTVGNTGGAKFEFDNRLMFGKHLSIIGSTMGTHQDFRTVMGLLYSGRLEAIVDTVYPLEEGPRALGRLEEGDVTGKLVLTL